MQNTTTNKKNINLLQNEKKLQMRKLENIFVIDVKMK